MKAHADASPAPEAEQTPADAGHLNTLVVQGVRYPTKRAAAIAADALAAAHEYYKLFFYTEMLEGDSSAGNAAGSPVYDPNASTRSSTCSDTFPITPIQMDNTPYHTFFPPVLSHKHREAIVRAILGGRASRSSEKWSWRKAEDYHVLHASSVRCNSTYQDFNDETPALLLPPPRTERDRRRPQSSTTPQVNPFRTHADPQQPQRQRRVAGNMAAVSPTDSTGDGAAKVAATNYSPTTSAPSVVSGSSGVGAGGPQGGGELADSLAGSPSSKNIAPPPQHSSCPPLPHIAVGPDFMSDQFMFTIPTSQQGPEYFSQAAEEGTKTLIIIMVGLPARGKTFLAQKVCRLLSWHGRRAKVHNIQVAWRRVLLDWERSQRAVDNMRESYRRESVAAASAAAATAAADAALKRCSVPLCPSMQAFTVESEPPEEAGDHDGKAIHENDRGDDEEEDSGCNGARVRSPTAADDQDSSSRFLRVDHFQSLIQDRNSVARHLYRRVLHSFAKDCEMFFQHGGEVVVINDDFVTEELRMEAEKIFTPLTSQLIYMEVIRGEDENKQFNDCKVMDPLEYPSDTVTRNDARRDFSERVRFLERIYEPLQTAQVSNVASNDAVRGGDNSEVQPDLQIQRRYIKVRNPGTLEIHGISGYLGSRIISYVMNLSQMKVQHPIYFVRHGESCYNLEDRIGGNPLLTEQGMRDAAALLEFLDSLKQHLQKVNLHQRLALSANNHDMIFSPHTQQSDSSADTLEIWTSQLRRAVQTAELSERLLGIRTLRWSSLNEIHAGVCEDMTYAEVGETYPLIQHFRKESKYTFRYPEGESYQDLVVRLEPVIMELENANKVVVVVAHQAVLRCLLAYFGSTSAESSIRVKVPHRTLWRCTYDSKGIASLDELLLDNTDVGFHIKKDDEEVVANVSSTAAPPSPPPASK